MADYSSGKDGTATIAGTELPVTSWNVNTAAEIVRFRNSLTDLYDQKESTFMSATGSITFDFNPALNPFGAPITLRQGQSLTSVLLYINGTAGLKWQFPLAIVTGVTQGLSVAGAVETTVNFENDAAFKAPGEA